MVIPAYNEAAVIERCLDALIQGFAPGELEIIVVCNGCEDDTAELAGSHPYGARVLSLDEASKAAALRTGDAAAAVFPRIYLDADVVLPGPALRSLLESLRGGTVAARPPLRYEYKGASWPVRSYFRARSRNPAVLGSLWGAGAYGLSEAGRSRFDDFPDLVADDLWVDRLFEPAEVEIIDSEPVVVTVPSHARDLVKILRRAYRGKAEPAPASGGNARPSTTTSSIRSLGRLAASGPRAALDAAVYLCFAVVAKMAVASVVLSPFEVAAWERDNSSRGG